MAIAFVQDVNAVDASSGSTLTTAATAMTAGNLLVAVYAYLHNNVAGGTPTRTISDSAGNTWVQNVVTQDLGIAGVVDGMAFGYAYAANIGGSLSSNTVTFTLGDNRTDRAIVVLEYSGMAAASALDAVANGTDPGGSLSPAATGPLSTAQADELVVLARGTVTNGNHADWNAFTFNSVTATNRTGATNRIGVGDNILSATVTGATGVAGNNNPGVPIAILAAAFKAAGGGGFDAATFPYTSVQTPVRQRTKVVSY